MSSFNSKIPNPTRGAAERSEAKSQIPKPKTYNLQLITYNPQYPYLSFHRFFKNSLVPFSRLLFPGS
jgi:hypothetical protein